MSKSDDVVATTMQQSSSRQYSSAVACAVGRDEAVVVKLRKSCLGADPQTKSSSPSLETPNLHCKCRARARISATDLLHLARQAACAAGVLYVPAHLFGFSADEGAHLEKLLTLIYLLTMMHFFCDTQRRKERREDGGPKGKIVFWHGI